MNADEVAQLVPRLALIAGENDDVAADRLPIIECNGRPLRDITADALNALERANDPPILFVRSGAVVRTRRDEQQRPMIELVTQSHMRGALTRSANFARTRPKSGGHVAPPIDVVRDLLALGSWPLPPLRAIIEAPAMRPDGTVMSAPGYDPDTRLLYAPAAALEMATVDDRPTDRQRADAVALIEEALEGFPFVDDASRANAIALMLTPILRPAIRGHVPLALVDAPKAGTGKGLLVELASVAATGRAAAAMAAPTREEEWAKTILAALIRGSTFILLDEAAELRSPALASALTATTFEGRILGSSETVQLPQRATWAAAGNNIRLAGDLARRCYWIRLDAKTSRPWQRTGFRHPDLPGWAADHRPQLLGALLTLARSWYAEGRPPCSTPMLGGFSEWASTVGGVLAHTGVTDFLGNLEEMYDLADEESATWETFLQTWRAEHGDTPVTVAGLAEDTSLRDALPEDVAVALAKSAAGGKAKLGRALGKRAGTRYSSDGLRVERAGKDRSAVSSWRVVVDEPRSDTTSAGLTG